MARTSIYKSEVKRARDALLAQRRNPSIDAIRIELGNTGSKTTIHRYLQELEEEEGAGFGTQVAVSEALQNLVGRLAERLHEEAEVRINESEGRSAAQLEARDHTITEQRAQIADLSERLQQLEATRGDERGQHDDTRRSLARALTAGERLDQQVTDLADRLKDNEAHRVSLEEKHQHARDALEHYRQTVKDQREQEQRRHEGQVQQLQVEIRNLGHTLIVKQGELTTAYQEQARVAAELTSTRKELRAAETERSRLADAHRLGQERLTAGESTIAFQLERLRQVEEEREQTRSELADVTRRLNDSEAARQRLQGTIDAQEKLLVRLTPAVGQDDPTMAGD
jgi:chromosome segregation ATPase